MKLLFRQRFLSWFDSYDVYNESDETVYTVKGQPAFGHSFRIFDAKDLEVGFVEERVFSFMPVFDIYLGEEYVGRIKKEFNFFTPRYNIDFKGWDVEGDLFEWDYTIVDENGETVATVSKEVFEWTDTYVIDVKDPRDALDALMLVVAIDAEKCSRK